ncbi:rod shape-determining protein [Candidatus Wolfebacteria bacterium]|uniref:Cell shape-determining protein MreB n=1 Tax=Candidatus Wolfebacteria bacterium CG_4_10_14_0_2_um_filter_39_18 TaxID=1975061 RepID=A0A2M7TGX5_9BACT|nr:rod shape-determining protein [Candidatus Wolfebacteria bacterium]NCO44456.1 rod shape-determining protein [Candidatus Wolfebacteria bacterium]PIZ45422.1 MAG: rod shape-determining protein [Candidatus Wolfebacteria bacterium CG_4_10_14_0_2_um_filter_39_18]
MFLDYFRKDIGIDLGTANSLVYIKDRGIILNEPSLTAVNNKTGQILAIGEEAKKMVGRAPAHISIIRPLINGVISDFEITKELFRHFLKKVDNNRFFNYSRVVIGVPTNLTEVERKSVEDAALLAGAARAYLVEEPVAAALGARLPVDEPTASMIVDMGGGTTEIAVISMGGVVISQSLKIAGDKLNDDIIKFVRDEFKLMIGEPTAEELKMKIGSAIAMDEKLELPIRGRDMATGLPREVVVKGGHIRMAINRSLRSVVEAIKETIEKAPPELVGDILKNGVFLCGGGSLLKGMSNLIQREIAVEATVVDDALTCVVRGAGIITDDIDKHSRFLAGSLKPMEINI